jgi:hypothetical protein
MAGKSKTAPTDEPPDSEMELTDEEIELIARVLTRHRTTLPTYLLSMQHEIELLDSILEKLADFD